MKKQRPSEEQDIPLSPLKYTSLFIFIALIQHNFFSQTDSLFGFDNATAVRHASYANTKNQRDKIYIASERRYIRQRFFPPTQGVSSKGDVYERETAGNCDNIGFENSNTGGWAVQGDYKIVSSGNDVFGNFPKVFPGGKYSLQLNDNNITNKTTFKASATKLFTVSTGNSSVNLHFAMVILNFPHDSSTAARFRISLRDSTNHVTLCPQFNCYYEFEKGAVGSNNFKTSKTEGSNIGNEHFPVTYASWQSIGIDLSPYVGKKIALQISCDWCVFDYDWAYCYIDADCNNFTASKIPCSQTPAIVAGPPGFQVYKWILPGGKVLTGNSPTVTIQGTGTYTLRCNHTGKCSDLPFVYLYTVEGGVDPKFDVVTNPCSLTVTLTAANTSSTFASYTWKWEDSAYYVGKAQNVKHTFRYPGIHDVYLEVKNKEGCLGSAHLTLSVNANVDVAARTNDPESKLYGPDDKRTYEVYTHYNGYLNYTWTGENFYEKGDRTEIGEDGIYVLEAVDPQTGCKDTAVINVLLNGWVPNIFTPNGDGTNDQFRFRTRKGTILHVYDRWGHLVYESYDSHGVMNWDGKHNERDCADAVFVYLLKPIDPKSAEKSKTGTLTLLR